MTGRRLPFVRNFVRSFYVFRASNSQKDAFRRDPTAPAVAHLEAMPTKRGRPLARRRQVGCAAAA
jgi:hypothetical protein